MSVCVTQRFTAACLCLLALSALLAVPACKEDGAGGGVRVKSFKFDGLKAVSASQLNSVLATVASSKLPWGEKRYFSREQFEADLKRIVAFYRDRGFPDARVTSFDAELDPEQTAVDLTVRISEGEPIRVERLDLVGFDVVVTEFRQRILTTRLPLVAGAPLDRALLQATRETAVDQLKESGYPYAAVRVSENPGANERSRIIVLTAQPGTLARFGAVDIVGNSSVNDGVVQRQLTYKPGEIYRHSRMLESQRRLYALEIFDFANIEALRQENEQPVEIQTKVTLTEGKHRKVNFGLGYGSEERARAQMDWQHVNFFGGARTAGVLARYSSLDRGVKLNFTQPSVFGSLFSFTLAGQFWHNDEPAYKLDNIGGRATLTRQFGRRGAVGFRSRGATVLGLTYANEWEDYEIAPEVLEDSTLRDELIALGLDPTGGGVLTGQRSSISVDLGRNTTGNILDARRGYAASIHLEQAGRWLKGDYDYYELTGEGRYFKTIFNGPVLAFRARAGSIDPLGRAFTGDELNAKEVGVPFYKRYFLGGATNLRGWGRFEVAPLSGSGLPIGGHTVLDFSTELRVPVWKSLGAVLFVDAGNVWRSPWDFNVTDLRYDIGPGLRYNTRIGPIRADFGYQLNPIPGLVVNGDPTPRRFRFHFSIGQAF
jgi:outer membrane protein insertion porin family/translocation and assembly module TamA